MVLKEFSSYIFTEVLKSILHISIVSDPEPNNVGKL